jgi:replicative DNA helicase
MSELMNLGKVPPHSQEAEQTVLGAALIDHFAVEKILNLLKTEDFYFDANKEIFDSIMEVHMQNVPVDVLTVTEELKKREKLDYVGGLEYLANLTENIITSKNVEAYCNIIKEKSTLRKLISASSEIIEKGYKENDDVQNIIELAESRIFSISQNRNINSFTEIKDVLLEVFNQLEERANHKGSITGLTTGYDDLDRMTSGMQKSRPPRPLVYLILREQVQYLYKYYSAGSIKYECHQSKGYNSKSAQVNEILPHHCRTDCKAKQYCCYINKFIL